MSSTRPPNGRLGSVSGPLDGPQTPTTPRSRAGEELNLLIESISSEFGLPLPSRQGLSSPSKRVDSFEERCVNHISFLFFRNKKELHHVIDTFRTERQKGEIYGDVLGSFYEYTRAAWYLEKERPNGGLRLCVPAAPPSPATPPALTSKRPNVPKLSSQQTRLVGQIKKPSRDIRFAAGAASLKSDSLKGTKRSSSDEEDEQPVSSIRSRKKRHNTHVSGHATNVNASFFQRRPVRSKIVDLPSTLPNSGDSTNDEYDLIHGHGSSEGDYGDLEADTSQVEQLMTSFEQPHIEISSLSTSDTDRSLGSSVGLNTSQLNEFMASFDHPGLVKGKHRLNSESTLASTSEATVYSGTNDATINQNSFAKPGKAGLEHRLIRSLPTDGLFSRRQSLCIDFASHPFPILWNSYRIATAAGKSMEDVLASSPSYSQQIAASVGLESFEQTPESVWEATKDPGQAANVIYKGNLTFSVGASPSMLFSLSLQALKCERASRLQRQFGSDRFLYIEMPQLSRANLPHYVKGQNASELLKTRFQEWMCTEKSFLGRKWRVFHVQDIKRKTSHDKIPSQRLVLFAVEGPGLPTVSIWELLNWAIPLNENRDQGFCKAYARLDLFLSQTIPTVVFRPSEVKVFRDIRSNGTPEATEFNDPTLLFELEDASERRVMTDGCSLISVGAAKEICEQLEIRGIRPVAFQARINGCKGVWSISAPYDTTDPKHLARWIRISESQRKVFPRAEDLIDAKCEPERWSFELVKATSSPKASALNLEFIPILADRGISRDTIQDVIETQLQTDFDSFLDSLEAPVAFRQWIHSQFSAMEQTHRASVIREVGALPAEWVEKAIFLIEAGFKPLECKYLATCIEHVSKLYLSQIRQKLKIQLGKSTMVLGIADPTGCLKPGEIHMAFSETFRDEVSGDAWSYLKGEVLVARHPSLRRSDVQKVKAVYKEKLSHLLDVVVFPSKGCVPLAHKLQGGDYDGDTFWLCWDPRLTASFKNAPVSLEEPSPNKFGIQKDSRKLGDVLGRNNNNVDEWLLESFKFKLQEDLLGQATNYHKKLAYKENSISSSRVETLVDLHDLIIDSAKNGYTFTFDAFQKLTKETLGIKKGLYKPAYESWMEPIDDLSNDNIGRLEPNDNHIIDYLLFRVVNPSIEQFEKRCQSRLADAGTGDEDLETAHRDFQKNALGNTVIQEVLKQLTTDLATITYIGVPGIKKTKEAYATQVNKVYETYNAIQPLHSEDPLMQEWTRRLTPFAPTTWELVKAATLYTQRLQRNPSLVFSLAGRELCYIKATSRPFSRAIVSDVYGIYKPRKEKKSMRALPAPASAGTSLCLSSEDEFFDCQ